ncbi:hypothetical protein [Bacillus thuringiensis]|uniref:Uncharacterized protein n=1 Tax=Bacillus thuringiensis TaxID=1428 RepID=A0A9X6Z4X5_BACTU|nr:hypothetical protein [Bacillus thuringiensis]MEC3269931.1 hypothetical protein [Bacillus thuringiensis]PFB07987.1 hypothetical protein CN398_09665 [Bacillus thuringiensis]
MLKIYNDNIPKKSLFLFLEKAKKLFGLSSIHMFFLPCNYTELHVKEIIEVSKSREIHIQYMLQTNEDDFVFKNTIVFTSFEWNRDTQLKLLKYLYMSKMWNLKKYVSDRDVNSIVRYAYQHYFHQEENMQLSA